MIEVFEGRIGGGKSYNAVKRAVKYFGSGGVVCTNINLELPEVKKYCEKKYGWGLHDGQYIKLEEEQIALFHRHTPSGTKEKPSLVIIDEAHIYLNSRDWHKQERELLTFLTQSRKCHTDIIFISQSAKNIDSQIMRLVQYIWRFRDLKKFVIPGLGINYPFNQILTCQYDYDGKTLLTRGFEMKDTKIFALYNTNELIRTFPRLDAKVNFEKKKLEGKNKMGKIAVVALLLIVVSFFGIRSIYRKFTSKTGKAITTDFIDKVKGQKKMILHADSLYDIKIKKFTGYFLDNNRLFVYTDDFIYSKGKFAPSGLVLEVGRDLILVKQSNQRILYIINGEGSQEKKAKSLNVGKINVL